MNSSTDGVVLEGAYPPWVSLECGKQGVFSSPFPASQTRLPNRNGSAEIQWHWNELFTAVAVNCPGAQMMHSNAAISSWSHTDSLALQYSVLGWHEHLLSCNRMFEIVLVELTCCVCFSYMSRQRLRLTHSRSKQRSILITCLHSAPLFFGYDTCIPDSRGGLPSGVFPQAL